MTLSALFSPPQLVGYVALVLGVLAFLQKTDRRLKVLIAGESIAYVVHFILLGNYPASGSAAVSCLRTLSSIRTRAVWLMGVFVVGNLMVGVLFAKGPAGWLPVVGSCLATVAVFRLRGVVMRLALLLCTALWLTNNILSGSVGGTLLESAIALANVTTTTRMIVQRRRLRRRLLAGRGASKPQAPAALPFPEG
jgi:hypothetical protein